MNRREFISKIGLGTVVLGTLPMDLFAGNSLNSLDKLTILHTNDTHSRINPFPKGSRYEGLGGVAKRASLIKSIREKEKNILLFDSGDIFQGTPYFNEFGGELELKLMSKMGYDASTLGNHDFDAGIEGLVNQLPNANFPFLNVNYNFENTLLHQKVDKYKIFKKGNLKIGVFGVGIELDGLVPDKLCEGVLYLDPIKKANQIAKKLKLTHKCDLVVCLSHLGLEYKTQKVSDKVLALQSKNIDVILGAHTHTFLEEPLIINNIENKTVLVNQVGWAGIVLGRLDIYFNKNNSKENRKNHPVIFSKKTIVK